METVIVALDGPESERALPAAQELATQFLSRIVIVHVNQLIPGARGGRFPRARRRGHPHRPPARGRRRAARPGVRRRPRALDDVARPSRHDHRPTPPSGTAPARSCSPRGATSRACSARSARASASGCCARRRAPCWSSPRRPRARRSTRSAGGSRPRRDRVRRSGWAGRGRSRPRRRVSRAARGRPGGARGRRRDAHRARRGRRLGASSARSSGPWSSTRGSRRPGSGPTAGSCAAPASRPSELVCSPASTSSRARACAPTWPGRFGASPPMR